MPKVKNQKDNAEFIGLIERLKAMYSSWELPYILLTQKLGQENAVVKISELAKLARETFLAIPVGKDSFNQNDPKFSIDSFRNDVLHAVSGLQRRLVKLFQKDKNECGYMLLVSDDHVTVFWEKHREGIKQFMIDKNKQEKAGAG